MKLSKEYVLVEETLTKKTMLTLNSGEDPNETTYSSELKIKQMGEGYSSESIVGMAIPDSLSTFPFAVGDVPVIASWAINSPDYVKVISGKVGDQTIIREKVYKLQYLIGTNNPE